MFEAFSPLGNPSVRQFDPTQPMVLEDPVIKEIAAKHSVSAAQVCIAFPLHRGMVVIPKTANPARITENLKSTELKLDQEDMRRLRGVDRNLRLNSVSCFINSIRDFVLSAPFNSSLESAEICAMLIALFSFSLNPCTIVHCFDHICLCTHNWKVLRS